MVRRPTRPTRTNTLCPYTTLYRAPGKIDIARPLNQTGRGAFPLSHFDGTKRIGAVGRTDHEHQIARGCDRLDRCLPVGRSVADVLTLGSDNRSEYGR